MFGSSGAAMEPAVTRMESTRLEPRHWLGALKRVGDLGKLLGRNVVVLGAGHAVDEGEGELHAVGIVHHVCQLLRGSGSLFDLQPLFGTVDGLGDHRFDIGAIG